MGTMMDQHSQFNNWMNLWDKAQEKWADETPQKPVKHTNFFGLQNNPVPEEASVTPEEGAYWRSVYDRAEEIKEPVLFTEEETEGWRKLLTPPGKDVTFFHHPQHVSSVGMDQGKSPYEPTRVAPNFTDGKELRELNDLKVKLEKLESTLLSKEIKAGKANVPAKDYKVELDKLRSKIDDLSDRLTPEPAQDVY